MNQEGVKKGKYESPHSEVFVMETEGSLLNFSNGTDNNTTSYPEGDEISCVMSDNKIIDHA